MGRRARTGSDDGSGSGPDEGSQAPPERPSKSQRKRDVENITKMGEALVVLNPKALARLDLDEDLLYAIRACAPLTRSPRNRQIKLIGKMLRSRDHEAIRDALAGIR